MNFHLIDGNDIRCLELAMFNGLKNLEKLELNNNCMECINADDFKGLGKLNYLDLADNSLDCIDLAPFLLCPKLKFLDFSWNRISRVESTSLLSRYFTQMFILSTDALAKPVDYSRLIQTLPELEEFHLYQNKIDITDRIDEDKIDHLTLSCLRNIKRLSMFSFGLTKPLERSSFLYYKNLKHLNLSDNELTHVHSGTFDGLEALEELNLAYCHVNMIQADLFRGLVSLKKLLFFNNPFEFISPQAFDDLPAIKVIALYNNLYADPIDKFASFSCLPEENFNIYDGDIYDDITAFKQFLTQLTNC
jgi:Leucine-rich repeat (LRR) protein